MTEQSAEPVGLRRLRAAVASGHHAPIADRLGFRLVGADPGIARFEGEPDATHYNPMGSVHGGYAATLLDSACGCAVSTRLGPDHGFTTLELKISYHRALDANSGTVRVEGRAITVGRRAAFAEATLVDGEGRLCASATSTLLIFERK